MHLRCQEGVIGIALFLAHVERAVIRWIEWRAAPETLDQIGIGQQQTSVGNGICRAVSNGLLPAGKIKAIIENEIARVACP